ncbi:hypothetical protein FA15DRAFT_655628 [Coprinopsis marcescibilis]|uniref:Conserved oligomeric Golgi complex subunit 3 C-terminal domain-containing protein n=1 Tax=Coprinopsis marcescibilis TaxID=230819 RepID=A0A5C3KVQ2_COPMA|nr:hypothetical protein FA15DRAFT_655628 [Coprinopsis marcescibilis]
MDVMQENCQSVEEEGRAFARGNDNNIAFGVLPTTRFCGEDVEPFRRAAHLPGRLLVHICIEKRHFKEAEVYLLRFQRSRKALLLSNILEEIKGLDPTRSEFVELTRAGCGYPKQLCTDEFNLYLEFFGTPAIFEDIAQEAALLCRQVLFSARDMIKARPPPSTQLDGDLFLDRMVRKRRSQRDESIRGAKHGIEHGLRRACEEVIASSVSTTRNPIDQWVTRLQPFSSSDSNPTANITFNFQTPPLLSTALRTGVPTTSSAIDAAMLSTTTHVAALYAEFRVAIERDLRANVARIKLYCWAQIRSYMQLSPQYGRAVKILIDHIRERTLESFQSFVNQVRETLLGGGQDGEGRDLLQEIGSSQERDSVAAADARATGYGNDVRPRTFAHALAPSPTHPLSVTRGEEDPKPKDIHDYSSSTDDDDSRTRTNCSRLTRLSMTDYQTTISPELLQTFTAKSEGLFLWAETVLNHIDNTYDQARELTDILAGASSYWTETETAAGKLEKLYEHILSKLQWKDPRFVKKYTVIMGALVTLREPLSRRGLAALYSPDGITENDVHGICMLIRPLLKDYSKDDPAQPIHLLHLSVQEYLVQRAPQPFRIDCEVHEESLGRLCLLAIQRELTPAKVPILGYSDGDWAWDAVEEEREIPVLLRPLLTEPLWYSIQHLNAHWRSLREEAGKEHTTLLHEIVVENPRPILEVAASTRSKVEIISLQHKVWPHGPPSLALARRMAKIYDSLGRCLCGANRYAEALPLLQEAVGLYTSYKDEKLDTAVELEFAASLTWLGVCLCYLDRPDDAHPHVEEAVTICRQLSSTDESKARAALARSLQRKSCVLVKLKRYVQAYDICMEVVDLYRQLVVGHPEKFQHRLGLALWNLAWSLDAWKKHEEAVVVIQEEVELRRKMMKHDLRTSTLATSLQTQATYLNNAKRTLEAVKCSQEAVEIQRRLVYDDLEKSNEDLAKFLHNLASNLDNCGRVADAIPFSCEAIEIRRKLVANNPSTFEPDLADSLYNHALYTRKAGRITEAVGYGQDTVEIQRRLVHDDPEKFKSGLADSLHNLASNLDNCGRVADAIPFSCEAIEIRRQLVASDSSIFKPKLADSLYNHALYTQKAGRKTEAVGYGQNAVEIRRRLVHDNPEKFNAGLADSLHNLASHLNDCGRVAEAIPFSWEAIEIRRQLDLVGQRKPLNAGMKEMLNHKDSSSNYSSGQRSKFIKLYSDYYITLEISGVHSSSSGLDYFSTPVPTVSVQAEHGPLGCMFKVGWAVNDGWAGLRWALDTVCELVQRRYKLPGEMFAESTRITFSMEGSKSLMGSGQAHGGIGCQGFAKLPGLGLSQIFVEWDDLCSPVAYNQHQIHNYWKLAILTSGAPWFLLQGFGPWSKAWRRGRGWSKVTRSRQLLTMNVQGIHTMIVALRKWGAWPFLETTKRRHGRAFPNETQGGLQSLVKECQNVRRLGALGLTVEVQSWGTRMFADRPSSRCSTKIANRELADDKSVMERRKVSRIRQTAEDGEYTRAGSMACRVEDMGFTSSELDVRCRAGQVLMALAPLVELSLWWTQGMGGGNANLEGCRAGAGRMLYGRWRGERDNCLVQQEEGKSLASRANSWNKSVPEELVVKDSTTGQNRGLSTQSQTQLEPLSASKERLETYRDAFSDNGPARLHGVRGSSVYMRNIEVNPAVRR